MTDNSFFKSFSLVPYRKTSPSLLIIHSEPSCVIKPYEICINFLYFSNPNNLFSLVPNFLINRETSF